LNTLLEAHFLVGDYSWYIIIQILRPKKKKKWWRNWRWGHSLSKLAFAWTPKMEDGDAAEELEGRDRNRPIGRASCRKCKNLPKKTTPKHATSPVWGTLRVCWTRRENQLIYS
jgi:hypothetical protein